MCGPPLYASTTNLDASGEGYPVQGCQQGNMPVMQGQGPAWFGAQRIPQQQTFMQQNAQARVPFLLVSHALTQNDAESPVSIFLLTFTKAIKNTCPHKKVFTSRHGLFV